MKACLRLLYRCTGLEHLVLPQSVQVVGSTILRSNNTQVHIRADVVGENWAENWNAGNTNTDVDYSSQYIEPLELETIYRTTARTSEPQMVGYAKSLQLFANFFDYDESD